ncbi:MAG: T9SS type A sorting domain-containing protein, partial [Tunicatimonas sp.]
VSFVDQSGNEIPSGTPLFLGAEWGDVLPFSLQEAERQRIDREGITRTVYHDPGPPCFIDQNDSMSTKHYQWGFALVSKWSSHLDPSDQVMWDISPRSMGNLSLEAFPKDIESLPEFYRTEGGQPAAGYATNPATNQPYQEQMVYRGDYTRVLAEFWADGPDSETPPGHWFTLLNYVSDHPQHEHKFRGEGPLLTQLEWDVKSYFMLGGAMHDAAISAWSIKGYYDYIRPISAIRYLAAQGQSSDPALPRYSPQGIRLDSGYVALVEPNDPLAGEQGEHVGKIKLFAWKGHREIQDASEDQAGVGWILAEEWWPYQRPNFVTPPFAGYVSGHSTFSRAAAEVLTQLTGDEYFPGGMGEFVAKRDNFLVFEKGPSTDVVLQWATYYDASDQCSLSRIWGGIHPPVDDIPGRLIGAKVGRQAFDFARKYFDSKVVLSTRAPSAKSELAVYPNPATPGHEIAVEAPPGEYRGTVVRSDGNTLLQTTLTVSSQGRTSLTLPLAPAGVYLLRLQKDQFNQSVRLIVSQ